MKLDEMKKLAKTLSMRDERFVNKAHEAKRYYKSENDIIRKGYLRDMTGLRSADNRVPSNFLRDLIDAKAAYMSNPVVIDVGNEEQNKIILDTLGEKWKQVVHDMIVMASIAGCTYIHFWIDANNEFQYAPIEAEKIMPLESNDLISDLEGVIYQHKIIKDGEYKTELDYFNDTSTFFYINNENSFTQYDSLEEYYPWINYKQELPDIPNEMRHEMGRVPFIKFKNNRYEISDLTPIKGLIDSYDKVLSGYINDLEDIQQIFMVLKGYEGQDLDEFKNMLKKYKIIKLEDDPENPAGLEMQSIQIPYEARNTLLELLRKRIIEDGQGYDFDPQAFANKSGIALKNQYNNLEIKSAALEMNFRHGIEILIRQICKHHGFEPEYVHQTWTRNIPVDEESIVAMTRNLEGVVSKRDQLNILTPIIEDPDEAYNRLQEERNAGFDEMNFEYNPPQEVVNG